jgi:predicted Fe-Mo cluster-binding NifX family protein
MRVAIPRFGEEVAPCFEYSATIAIFIVSRGKVLEQRDYALQSQEALDRVRLLRDQGVDTLICGGVQELFEDLVRAHGIRVISWVSGNVDDLLEQFLAGRLVPGSGRLGERPGTAGPGVQKS